MSTLQSGFDLTGRTALITGGNRGIGLGIAVGMAEAGARVAVLGRDERHNAAALAQLKRVREGCLAFAFDLENTDRIPELYDRVLDATGGVDVLVNNAGATIRGRAEEVPVSEFERVLRVNLTASYAMSCRFARERIDSDRPGAILMTASLMSEAARPTTSAYTASKGGVRQMVKALAVDWAPFGIRVNGIGPGYIRTSMTRPLVEDEDFSDWVRRRTPLGRWGEPEDLAGAAVFLAWGAEACITCQGV